MNEIRKGFANSLPQAEFYFWRTASGEEIDIVLERNGLLIPIEVKFANRLQTKDFKAILDFSTNYKEQVPISIIVYNGDFQRLGDRVIAVPSWAWF